MIRCDLCNSDHEPDAFSVGYFLIDGEIVKVEGEENVWEKARDPDFPSFEVFWSMEALEQRIEFQRQAAEDAEFQAALETVKMNQFRAAGRAAVAHLKQT